MAVNVEKVPQPGLAQHDSSVLDLAFAMDCTGSMGSYIENARNNIRKIVETIVSQEKSDIHMALVEYRDHPPQDQSFVTRVNDFTPSVSKMKGWLDQCSASGGGDRPEAVADALHAVLKLNWRENATKICVFIADAPPHGLLPGDHFSNGCPDGLDPMVTANQLAEKNITVYMVGCEPAIVDVKDFFVAVAHITGGQYVPLSNASLLAQVIIGGAQEEISLQRLMEEVEQDVMQAAKEREHVDEEAISKEIHAKMESRGVQAKQLQMNKAALPEASGEALNYAAKKSMAELRKDFKANPSMQQAQARGFRFSAMAPSAAGGASVDLLSGAPESSSYCVASKSIDQAQASRLVSKAMYKNKLK